MAPIFSQLNNPDNYAVNSGFSGNFSTVNLLGFQIFCDRLEKVSFDKKMVINTINPHSYNTALRDPDFHRALLDSDILLPDGVGIVMANKLINNHEIKKIAGFDIFKFILNISEKKPIKCFFLGSSENTLNKIKIKLANEFPNIQFGAYSPPFKEEFSEEDNFEMRRVINAFQPDFLFVGMSAPKQEKWTLANKEYLNVNVICSIGAVFDFYAETTKRAPKILVDNGLEWVHRTLSSTRLFKRNIVAIPLFLYNMIDGNILNFENLKKLTFSENLERRKISTEVNQY